MIFLQSEMPTLPPFKTTNIGPFFKILLSIIPTFRDFLQISQFEWIAPLSALKYGLPWWLSDKEPSWQCRRCGFVSWVGDMAWRRKWQPMPVFFPGKSHYRGAWQATVHGGHKELDTTEWLSTGFVQRWMLNLQFLCSETRKLIRDLPRKSFLDTVWINSMFCIHLTPILESW